MASIFDAVAGVAPAGSKRDAILAAATRVFLSHGYGDASMDMVAREAGAARRTLYNQFPNGKEELFRAIVERAWSGFLSFNVQAAVDGKDPRAGLLNIGLAIASFWESQFAIDFMRMIVAEGKRFPDLPRTFINHGKAPAMITLQSYIGLLEQKGIVSVASGERAATQFLGLIHEPLLWIRVLGGELHMSQDERQRVVVEAVEIFFAYYSV